MKHHKNKKINVPKFLFIFVGLLSCVGALYIQETLSYFYTSYGFANTFQTPDPGSVEIYQKATIPEVWKGEEVSDEVHIANKSSDSRYLRVAYVDGINLTGSENLSYTTFSDRLIVFMQDIWNGTNGLKKEYDFSKYKYPLNEDKWIQDGPWHYYKIPLDAGTDIQIYDAFKDGRGLVSSQEDTGKYISLGVEFVVETLPTTVSDEEFQNAWGVSKSELGLS